MDGSVLRAQLVGVHGGDPASQPLCPSSDYAPYVERWPELATFDFSAVSTPDFMRAMPPGMLMEILSNQRRQNRGW